jgi:hypothetical protein
MATFHLHHEISMIAWLFERLIGADCLRQRSYVAFQLQSPGSLIHPTALGARRVRSHRLGSVALNFLVNPALFPSFYSCKSFAFPYCVMYSDRAPVFQRMAIHTSFAIVLQQAAQSLMYSYSQNFRVHRKRTQKPLANCFTQSYSHNHGFRLHRVSFRCTIFLAISTAAHRQERPALGPIRELPSLLPLATKILYRIHSN